MLKSFLDGQGIIPDRQGSFRKGFSTSQSIADLTDKLFSSVNKGEVSLAVFVDLRKAFDTVDLNILLNKLRHYGVRDANLGWCSNYLTNRIQRTLAKR